MRLDRKLLAPIACLVCAIGCTTPTVEREAEHDEAPEAPVPVSLSVAAYETAGIQVAPAGRRHLVPTIRVTGALSYDERRMAIATARIGGRITRVVADYGQRVSRGDTLAWIDSPDLGAAQADYLRAQSMSRLRQAEVERARVLLQGEAISRAEMLRREAEWQAAQGDLQTTEQKLHLLGLSQTDIGELSNDRTDSGHEYPVRATIDGRVTERKAVPGRVVAAEDELFTVARLDSLWLFLQVFEKDLPALASGAAVTLTCESHPDHRFTGTVDFIGEVLDPHSRTVQARVVIANPDGKLKPGMFVYASIEGRSEDGNEAQRLAVPLAAVAQVDGRDVVFVQTAERSFELRQVELGEADPEWVVVRSGLSEGQTIAVEGVFTLKSEFQKGGLEEHGH